MIECRLSKRKRVGVCGERLTVAVILEGGRMDAERHIKDVLPTTVKCWETTGLTKRMG